MRRDEPRAIEPGQREPSLPHRSTAWGPLAEGPGVPEHASQNLREQPARRATEVRSERPCGYPSRPARGPPGGTTTGSRRRNPQRGVSSGVDGGPLTPRASIPQGWSGELSRERGAIRYTGAMLHDHFSGQCEREAPRSLADRWHVRTTAASRRPKPTAIGAARGRVPYSSHIFQRTPADPSGVSRHPDRGGPFCFPAAIGSAR